MIQNILQANTAGFTAQQVVDFLVRKFPQYKDVIQKTISSGFTADQVLKYLTGGRKEVNRYSEENKTELEQTYDIEKSRQKDTYKNVGKGLAIAGTALGGAGLVNQLLKRAAPSVAGIAEAVIPEVLPSVKEIGLDKKEIPFLETSAIPSLKTNTEASASTPEESLSINQTAEEPKINSVEFIRNLGPKIENFIKSAKSNPPEYIAKAIELHFLSPEQKKEIKAKKIPLNELISDYITQVNAEPEKPSELNKEVKNPLSEKLGIFPDGKLARVQSTQDGIAVVDIDGKKEKRKAADLIESPLPEEDLASLYDQLVSAIPEKDRSSQIFWSGYDENSNRLAFIPHGGALYVYDDIPPEFADKLKNSMFKAKTTGESKHGVWVAGGESRGAGLYQLIKELQSQYGGKGKEYSAKYGSIYDYFSVPREASKKKEQERKKRERDAKRKK